MKWFLTQQVIGEPEIIEREDTEDLSLGFSLIREMARDAGSGFQEIAPGVWYQSKGLPPAGGFSSTIAE